MDAREITLHCPLCTADHAYPLEVERSVSLGMTRPGQTVPTRRRSFVRLFACPVKSHQFEATLTLSETALDRIERISVGVPRVDG
jgi:hypothetical protein